MNGRAGALRDGFFQYVREAYDGQLQVPDRLEELVGVSVVELQRGLLDYLRGGKGP
jgi:hypothetical protein